MGELKTCKRCILFVNLHKKDASVLSEQIKVRLVEEGIEVVVFSFYGNPSSMRSSLTQAPPSGKWDIAFSLGGDGTVLYTARSLARETMALLAAKSPAQNNHPELLRSMTVPIFPVNLGSVGFLAEIEKDNWYDIFNKWKEGSIIPSSRCMFSVAVERASKTVMENFCLNDTVVSCTGIAKLIRLKVHLAENKELEPKVRRAKSKEQLMENKEISAEQEFMLGSYRCDGLIISTPTGSTAYSMAAGGPILDPEMDAVIINPICPFTLSNRPFVLTSKQTIVVSVAEDQKSGVLLTIDGQDVFNLECDDKIIITQSPYNAQLIFPGKSAYYSALRNKLFWPG